MSKNEFESVEEAIEMLSKGIVDITFIKKTDGSLRTMHSTLHKPFMPFSEYDTVNSVIGNSLTTDGSSPLAVWDLYHSGWRSFYMASTIEIQESLVFGDTTEMVEEMVEEKVSSDEELLTEEDKGGIISNITDIISGRIEEATKDAPERMAAFTASKITQILVNIIKGLKLRGGRGQISQRDITLKKKKTKEDLQKQLDEIVEVSKSAVIGYEKYLKDEINYQDLARIMTNLRKYLPMGTTSSDEK